MPKRVLETPSAPDALGPYSVAVESGGFVFVSGQVAIDPATGRRAPDNVAAQVKQIMENLRAILGDLGLTLADVAKTTIFLSSATWASPWQTWRRQRSSSPISTISPPSMTSTAATSKRIRLPVQRCRSVPCRAGFSSRSRRSRRASIRY